MRGQLNPGLFAAVLVWLESKINRLDKQLLL